jgi:cytochrome c-type biogenesis protein CcmH
MTLWISLTAMGILAVMFVAYPLYRGKQSFSPLVAIAVLVVSGLAIGIYGKIGSPDISSQSSSGMVPEMEEVITSLAARLAEEPDDLNGWKMLGRSYMSLGDYANAEKAFQKAVELESSGNAQTLVDLGSAILSGNSNEGVTGRSAALFESALALEPDNPQALFYGGIGAINRGDKELAASRWEKLLGLNPPEEIQGVLRQRVAEWKGEAAPMPAAAPAAAPAAPVASGTPLEVEGVVLSAEISLADSVGGALPGGATVYIIARDPKQPSPPIAVVRRRVSDLPTRIDLGDDNSMVPGRSLSGFPEFEIIARVSLSGQPVQQPGDWFTSAIVRPAVSNTVNLAIDTQIQ